MKIDFFSGRFQTGQIVTVLWGEGFSENPKPILLPTDARELVSWP
jgi:hypothetical protein